MLINEHYKYVLIIFFLKERKSGALKTFFIIWRLTQLSHVSWQRQEYSTITEEQKSETGALPEFTENEKKLKADIELLNKELIDLKSHKNDLEDKYKRALADGENLRVRLIKQIEDAKIFGIQGFCKDLLEVADILGKATESVPKDELTDKNPHLKTLYEGLKMTEAQLHKVNKKIFKCFHITVISHKLFLWNICIGV